MKKAAFLLCLISTIWFTARLYSQEYFFYDYKEIKTLNRNFDYIPVKFKNNISDNDCSAIISSSLGNVSESVSSFHYAYENGEKSGIVIVKLKPNISLNSVESAYNSLLMSGRVQYAGMCFKKSGKVLHFTTDEVIVKFKKNVSDFDIQNLNRLYNTTIIEKVTGFEGLYLVKINSRGETGTDNAFDISNRFAVTPFVEYAQPNFIRVGMLESVSDVPPHTADLTNDSLVHNMWHVQNTGHNIPDNVTGIPGCDLNLIQAWNITTGSPNVLFGIVDTGVDTNHADLRANMCDRSLWYDAVDNNQKPYDQYYHGTGVSGITSAIGNNHIGTVGVAYTCKFIPIRVFGPAPEGYTTDLILGKGLNWAWMHGASVINCSWGGGIETPLITYAIRNAVSFGRSGRGTVVCAGSGNDDTTVTLYPASMPEVMGIGGLSPCNQRKSRASCDNFSGLQGWGASYGEGLSVVAPCTYIGTTELFGGWCICGDGTSDSSPMAASVAALILSKNNNLSGDSVRIIMERSALKVGNYVYSNHVNKPNGLWNNEMGYGRIDAKVALDMTPAGPNEISDQVPPVIKIFPLESQVFSSSFSFNAEITDNQSVASGSNSPKLYYHTMQSQVMQSSSGVPLGSNLYRFTFPRLPAGMGVYYYIAAQDNSSPGNITTYPIGGRGTYPPGTTKPPRMMFLRNTAVKDTAFIASNTPVVIPPQVLSTTYSNFNCPFSQTILDVNCSVNVNHTYDENITISLISPAGTEIVLAGGVGHDGHNFTNTFFDDEASIAIDSNANHAPFAGQYRPIDRLWLLDGESTSGLWKLKVVDNGLDNGGSIISWGLTFKYSVYGDNIPIPDKFSLVENYPNPFNPTTRILFNVPYTAKVKIAVYDLTGRLVKTLLDETRSPGVEEFVDFDANGVSVNGGTGISSGVYFYTLIADNNFIESKRMVVLK